MSESSQKEVQVHHDTTNFRRMLEFIYTNNVSDIDICAPNEVISLLIMANEYLLSDLRVVCENKAATMINLDNLSKLMLLSAGHNASVLKDACGEFVRANKTDLASLPSFRQDVEANPELGLLLFESSIPKNPNVNTVGGESSSSGSKKRRRASEPGDNDLDLVLPQLNGNTTNTNTITIAQQNANVQDV